MTKQEIMIDYADFLATVLECKKSIKVPTDATLLEAYLYGYVLAYPTGAPRVVPRLAVLCCRRKAH